MIFNRKYFWVRYRFHKTEIIHWSVLLQSLVQKKPALLLKPNSIQTEWTVQKFSHEFSKRCHSKFAFCAWCHIVYITSFGQRKTASDDSCQFTLIYPALIRFILLHSQLVSLYKFSHYGSKKWYCHFLNQYMWYLASI